MGWSGGYIRKMVVLSGYTISPALPSGLSLDPETGRISGTPVGTSPAVTYTITARSGSGAVGTATIRFAVSNGGLSPSADQNYILTMVALKAFDGNENLASKGASEVQSTIQYFDGLGRPLQTVQYKGTPGMDKDVVVPNEYDTYGREAKKYLPYGSTSNDGSYKADAFVGQQAYYSSPVSGVSAIPYPFAETRYESSPLNRVEEQGASGGTWQLSRSGVSGSGHTIKMEYGTNTASGDRVVRLYRAEAVTVADHQHERILSSSGNYEASQLYLTISKDENWVSGKTGTIEEYKDKQGQVVLKRTWLNESTAYSTYYVYDDFGNLSFVLPPGAEPDNGGVDEFKLNKYVYQYRYDGRNRLIEKRIPGKTDWERMVYNKQDQVVLTQDAVQAAHGKWLYTKYDGLGRVVLSGEYASNASRTTLQSQVNGQSMSWESYVGGTANEGYTNVSFPTSSTTAFTVNYYDGYSFSGWNSFGALPVDRSGMVHSLLTGSKTRVAGTSTMLLSMYFYDDKGRVMQSRSQNYLGGVDSVLTSYTFRGEPETVTRYHSSPGGNLIKRARYDYDHMGRKLKTWERLNNEAEVLLSENVYNEIGQLWQKKLHNGLQTTSYAYNERGWLKSQSSAEFSEQLKYQDGGVPQYNGNISGQLWGAGSNLGQAFSYSYDALNRLVMASSPGLGESVSYDKMGNILSLSRDGYGTNTYSNYSGNRLGSISGFVNGSYGYDANGNMISGPDGLSMSYNSMNLPSVVTKGGVQSNYTYDYAGRKLRRSGGGECHAGLCGWRRVCGRKYRLYSDGGRHSAA